jgi:hypothetical protein
MIIISIVNKYDIIIFVMRTTSFSTMLLILTIILSGAVITISISLTDTLATSDNIDQKQIQQKDDTNNNNQKNYQQLYKQYDFEKYLNYHYTFIPQYYEDDDSKNNGADISEKNPFALAAAIDNDFKNKEDNKKQLQQQSTTREKDRDKSEYILELEDRKDSTDHKKYSSDKNDKKTYKNIKIIECRNFNINAYEVEDLKSIATLLNKPTTFENDDYANGNQQEKSHNEKNSREVKEYDINSNTKVIFVCNNENHDLRPINSNNLTQPLSNGGLLLPTHSQNNNNNNNGEDKTPTQTTISYAQYKKSISND